ncbi:MAG TPA: lyase family protein [Casimicrobiaceae bacterium]|nr:lyase family protein [Casimicrobiaceae bacterium]
MALRDIFASKPMAACFDDASLLAGMLAFELALAKAEAASGMIPRAAADGIDAASRSMKFDVALLADEARRAGTLAIPFVKHLTAHVASFDAQAARYVHWGATSQDVQDSALALQVRKAGERLDASIKRLGDAVARLADTHRATPMAARTLLQIATPVPFGWKAAVWLDALARARTELRRAVGQASVLQFGGASGVRAALGAQGDAIANAVAGELDLALPAFAWHSVRDRIARLGAELAITCGVLAKIAGDVALLMQPEVAEASEPAAAGRGGSSALPHKRNPVGSMLAREAGLRAPALAATLMTSVGGEHERGLGQWQSQFWTLGDLFIATGSAADAMLEVVEGLSVDVDAMQRNLDAMRGFVYAEALSLALAVPMGKEAAHQRVEALCKRAAAEGKTLQQALANDKALAGMISDVERERVFDPKNQFGSAHTMIDAALAAWRAGEH